MSPGCREVEHLFETFFDGELGPEQTLRVEAHLDGCSRCTEHALLLDSFRRTTRQAVYDDAPVSEAFVERVGQALSIERNREGHRVRARSGVWFGRARSVAAMAGVPLAVAAAVVLWLGHERGNEYAQPRAAAATVDGAEAGIEQALDRLIDHHSSPPPAQVTSADQLPLFDRDVGVRVHAPSLDKFGAHWEGASLVSVRNHRAASLRYKMPGRRFTVYVYDPRKVSVHGSLPRRIVRDSPVYVGEWRGYTVAAKEDHGIGYAMASDLDDALTAQLLTEIH